MLKNKIKPEFEKLCQAIESLAKPQLPVEKKQLLKSRLLAKLDAPVADFVRNIAGVELPLDRRVLLKERIFALIEAKKQKNFFWRNLFVYQKKFVSAFLLFVMAIGFFSYLRIDGGVVMAEDFTILEDFSGEVVVQRDGEVMAAELGMKIFERDQVLTGESSFATIVFFDHSVNRLAENTELSVKKLFRPAGSSVKSYVEVALNEGVLWSKVVNLVEKNSSFVVQADDLYFSTQKGAFNVAVKDDEVEVGVYNDNLDVRTAAQIRTIVSGEKAVFSSDKSVYLSVMNEEEKQLNWVKENLENDQKHVAKVEENILLAKAESVDHSSTLKEKTLLLVTFDDIKQQKLELDLAEKKFIEAQVQLEQGDVKDDNKLSVETNVNEFVKAIEEFAVLIEEVERTDKEYAAELKLYMEEKILVQKRNLSLSTPESPVYPTKEVVDGLEYLIVEPTVTVTAEPVKETPVIEEETKTEVEEKPLPPLLSF